MDGYAGFLALRHQRRLQDPASGQGMVPKVELGLQRAVLNNLDLETRLLERSELETALRRMRVKALTDLFKNWTF